MWARLGLSFCIAQSSKAGSFQGQSRGCAHNGWRVQACDVQLDSMDKYRSHVRGRFHHHRRAADG